jgi:porin
MKQTRKAFVRPALFAAVSGRVARFGVGILAGAFGTCVEAAPPPISIPASGDDSQPTPSGLFGFIDGINRSPTLLGDMWGLRTFLSRYGISLAVQETSEVLGNTSGGTGQGFKYDGLTQIVMQMDTQRAFDHYGGLFNISVLNIHGDNLSATHLQTLQTASGIEADRATRLWELWYDQKFLDEDRLDVKVGQQSLDQEFMVSTNAQVFVNTMFGWPMLPSADMPAGGPAYPLSTLGIRFRAIPVNGLSILAGVFNGDPVKNDDGSDPQLQDRHGTDFTLGEGTLAIAELQYSYPALGGMVEPGVAEPLGWTYRLGAWYDNKSVPDQRFGTDGLSLANPDSNGIPLMHKGDWAWYAVADRLVWRDDTDPNHTVALFARVMATPLKDRNLIDRSLNAGMVIHSPFTYRTDDTFDVGVGYAHVSRQASLFDIDSIDYGDRPGGPIRNDETYAEVTYQYQLKPWIVLQPDLQYVWRPGAGLPLPVDPTTRIHNEVVLGLRATIAL